MNCGDKTTHLNNIEVASAAQATAIAQGFQAFVSAQHPQLADESADVPLQLVIVEHSRVIAGLLGRVFWKGLEIEVLWVDQGHRQRGLGRQLLQRAEAEARIQGAQVAYLRTAQAAAFYERCGYQHCGYLPRPLGTGLHSYHKVMG
ncbi:GNAT superfamily N-acetyltransferase [Pseudomonas oryzihabitans]|uniref:GNAT family N-acetyltransferase n=1 Tax=Pseudomonas flavocrustae TaxID=2991719 RepID=A0ABT6IBP0_9PSED|nr:GNAT family N-acetyltransferase [Pseudomonas sp. CBMAI 2609]MDH4761950.1 GNAT family N-acetyltransferase [Pseudomonas sp. CBMAI 2609]